VVEEEAEEEDVVRVLVVVTEEVPEITCPLADLRITPTTEILITITPTTPVIPSMGCHQEEDAGDAEDVDVVDVVCVVEGEEDLFLEEYKLPRRKYHC